MKLYSAKKLARVSAISAAVLALIFVLPSVLGTVSYAAGPFSTPVNLSNDTNNAQYPMVANSGQHVYVVWTEESHGIFLRASSDGGATWGSAIKLSPKGGSASYPEITANGSYVYVAWSQTLSKIYQVYFTSSSDYGQTFAPAVDVDTNTSVSSITPVLASWGSSVTVAWSNNGPSYVRSSTDGGVTWGPAFNIGLFHEPQLAISGSNVYFVSDGHGGMSYGVSHDGGMTWSTQLFAVSAAEPWVAASGSYVYLVWEQKNTGGQAPIYGLISADDGNTFGAVTVFSGSVINDWEPQISASGNMVYLAFRSLSPQSAWITSSSNYGATWSTPTEVSNSGAGWPLDVAISGSSAFTIWGAPTAGSTWNAYASFTNDNGATWSPMPGVDLSNNANGVAAPATDVASASIAANGQHAFAVWESTQTGNEQIWFTYL